jgi:hypothetical protein
LEDGWWLCWWPPINELRYVHFKTRIKTKEIHCFSLKPFPQMVLFIYLFHFISFFSQNYKIKPYVMMCHFNEGEMSSWNMSPILILMGIQFQKSTIVTNKCYTNSQNIWYGIWYVQEHLSCDMIELWISKCLWVSFYKLFEL